MKAPIAIGNTYKRIPESKAKLDRSGRFRKVHDWTLYVDVIADADSKIRSDIIDHVEFGLNPTFVPSSFKCYCPIKVTLEDGTKVDRFSTRQQSFLEFPTTITIVGRGGSRLALQHKLIFKGDGCRRSGPGSSSSSSSTGGKKAKRHSNHNKLSRNYCFIETNPMQPYAMASLSPTRNFGIELELSCTQGSSRDELAVDIQEMTGIRIVNVEEYSNAHNPVHNAWKLVSDGSITCSRQFPNCSKFELVSPILKGMGGLQQCKTVLNALQELESISVNVNKSMGFHVHVDVSDILASTDALSKLIKICQNFIKYENAMDSFMPLSRRTGSTESDDYCQSNKDAISSATTNADRHAALANCRSILQLVDVMNPTGRYYKLNLQNLKTGRQPTIEFRQHSATSSFQKVQAWVSFCMAFVHNSARFQPPSSLKDSRTYQDEFDFLFPYVIKDRALQHLYKERQLELQAAAAEAVVDMDDDDDIDDDITATTVPSTISASTRYSSRGGGWRGSGSTRGRLKDPNAPEYNNDSCCLGCQQGVGCSRTTYSVGYSFGQYH